MLLFMVIILIGTIYIKRDFHTVFVFVLYKRIKWVNG